MYDMYCGTIIEKVRRKLHANNRIANAQPDSDVTLCLKLFMK